MQVVRYELCRLVLRCIIVGMTAQSMPPPAYLPGDLHAAIVGDLMAYMGRRRISQRSLATTIGVDQSTVSRWFNKDMTLVDLDRVLGALGLAGRLAFIDATTLQPTVPTPGPKLRAIKGEGRDIRPRTPLLVTLSP